MAQSRCTTNICWMNNKHFCIALIFVFKSLQYLTPICFPGRPIKETPFRVNTILCSLFPPQSVDWWNFSAATRYHFFFPTERACRLDVSLPFNMDTSLGKFLQWCLFWAFERNWVEGDSTCLKLKSSQFLKNLKVLFNWIPLGNYSTSWRIVMRSQENQFDSPSG